MADIVRQAQVLKTIIAMLTKEFKCKVYSEEVKEKFERPCFFIAATSVMEPQTVNWMNKELTVQITYYARCCDKNELVYMDVVDRVQMMFPVGITAGDRFLKIESIEDDRVGEEQDILQITMTIPYVERTNYHVEDVGELMDEIDMRVIHNGGRSREEVFPGRIDKHTV